MTIKDWLEAAAALLVLGSTLSNVHVSMELRKRDREDFEALREEHKETKASVGTLAERIAKLEGREP